MAGQARESASVLPPADSRRRRASRVSRSCTSRSAPATDARAADGDPTTLSALRAAERARALAGGDVDLLANDASRADAQAPFLKAGPEKEIYNPHAPAEAGLALPADGRHHHRRQSGQRAQLRSAGLRHRPGDGARLRQRLRPASADPARLPALGKYDNVVAFGQERALVIWQRIILPDGSSVVIDNLPATDTGGYAGLADRGRSPHLEAAEGRGARDRARRRQRARLRLLRQRPRQGAAAVDAVDHQPRGPAPGRAQPQCAADHHRAAGLAAARDRAQGHRSAALPRTSIEVKHQHGGTAQCL